MVTVVTPSHSEDITQIQAALERKSRGLILKSLLSFIRYFVPTQSRVYDLEDTHSADAVSALRSLCEGKPHEVQWRQGRSWILATDLQWDSSENGMLKVSGVVRGMPLSVNRLVHIPNYGDFQQSKVCLATCISIASLLLTQSIRSSQYPVLVEKAVQKSWILSLFSLRPRRTMPIP